MYASRTVEMGLLLPSGWVRCGDVLACPFDDLVQDAVCVLDSLLNYFSERAFARGTGAVFDEMAVGLQVLV